MTNERFEWIKGLFRGWELAQLCDSGELIDVFKECVDEIDNLRETKRRHEQTINDMCHRVRDKEAEGERET